MKSVLFWTRILRIFWISSLLGSSSFLVPNSVFACDGSGTSIYFGNGMFNSMNDVEDSMVELRKLNIQHIEASPSKIQYKTALNLSESDLDNILSVIHERVQGDLSYFWDVLNAIVPFPEWLNKPIQEALLSNIHSDTLETMLSQYQNDFQNQSKVILISHSQGNFYAEEAETELISFYHASDTHSFGFGNVRVATPTQTRFDYPYFTFRDDFIINLVRMILAVPVPDLNANGSGPGPELDPHGHSFVKAYLANADSRSQISEAIVNEANRTAYPCGTK